MLSSSFIYLKTETNWKVLAYQKYVFLFSTDDQRESFDSLHSDVSVSESELSFNHGWQTEVVSSHDSIGGKSGHVKALMGIAGTDKRVPLLPQLVTSLFNGFEWVMLKVIDKNKYKIKVRHLISCLDQVKEKIILQ